MDFKELHGLYEAYCEIYTPQEEIEEGLGTKIRDKVKKHVNQYAYQQGIHNNPGWLRKPEKRAALNKAVADDIKKNPKAAVKYAANQVKRKITGVEEELDIFDVVLEFLQAEGFAETLEEAEWMMANMIDEEAIDIILGEGVPLRGTTPDGKPWRVDPSPSGARQPAKMERNPKERTSPKGGDYKSKLKKSDRYEEVECVDEAQHARENPEKYEREQSKKYAPVRGEKTPMPPRGDKRREDFEKWYAKQMGR